jgi:hypothetical protein
MYCSNPKCVIGLRVYKLSSSFFEGYVYIKYFHCRSSIKLTILGSSNNTSHRPNYYFEMFIHSLEETCHLVVLGDSENAEKVSA